MRLKNILLPVIVAFWVGLPNSASAHRLIVDSGHDWGAGWYRQQPHQDQNSAWRPLAEEDLNNNGTTDDDFIGGWPYSWDEPLSPENLVYDYTYPSARFFGAAVTKTTDIPKKEDGTGYVRITGPTEGHINQNHELRDDWNLMTFPTIIREPERSRYAGALLVFWKKEDFLNGGDRYRVSFEAGDYIGIFISRYWGGIDWGRWVIKQDGQFYISEATFAGETQQFDLTDNNPGDGARNPVVRRTHTIDPNTTRWAEYHPEAPHHVFFDPDAAAFEHVSFRDVEAVGFLGQRNMSIGRPVAGGLWDLPHGVGEPIALKFNAAQARATVHVDPYYSDYVALRPVGDRERPAGYTTAKPVSYHEWLRVWRWAVTNQRSRNFTEVFERFEMPGYGFLSDGAMGAMETSRQDTHEPTEPVTMISWQDAILWCNALSELEGLEPAYYDDPEYRAPAREVFNRSKLEKRDERKPVYWNAEANGYRLPTVSEFAYAVQQGWISGEGPVAEWVWDVEGTVFDPARHTVRRALGGPERSAEHPTMMPFGERPFEGTYDVGFRVWRTGAGVPDTSAIVRERRVERDEVLYPASVMKESRLAALALHTLRPVLVEGAGGLPVNDNFERNFNETGLYDLEFAVVETPYVLWNLVRQWAQMTRGYQFNHAGDMGSLHYLVPGSEGLTRHREEPVTNITWLDAVVWCNALSELLGREPVYVDTQTEEPMRDARTFRVAMYQKYAYPNTGRYEQRPLDTAAIIPLRAETGRNGFRLPTIAEFEAAHERSTSEAHGWFATNADRRTQRVGRREPNAHGLFDMDGNVAEMTYGGSGLFGQVRAGNHFADPPGSYPHHITRGEHPAVGRSYLGFRVVAQPAERVE